MSRSSKVTRQSLAVAVKWALFLSAPDIGAAGQLVDLMYEQNSCEARGIRLAGENSNNNCTCLSNLLTLSTYSSAVSCSNALIFIGVMMMNIFDRQPTSFRVESSEYI